MATKREPLIEINPIETAITVPSTTSTDKPISKAQMRTRVNRVRKLLSDKFGGYTSVKGMGGWVEGGEVIKENIVKVTGFAKVEDYKKHQRALKRDIFELGKKWGQESMAFEKEGDLFFYNIKEYKRRQKLKQKLKRTRKKK